MKARLLVLMLSVLLTACAPADANPTRDLYAEAAASRATADAAESLAQFQGQFLTATQQAPIIAITQTAAALIVEGTQVSRAKTATADLWTPTPSPTSTPDLTATLQVSTLHAKQTELANNSIRDDLLVEQRRYSNQFYALLPGMTWLVVAVLAIVLVMALIRIYRYRPLKVSANGAPIPVMDIVNGTVTSIDRSPNYRADTREHLVRELFRRWLQVQPALPAPTAERQDRVTERDQMVALATRGAAGSSPARQTTAAKALIGGQDLTARFKVVPDGSNLEMLDKEIVQVLDAEWRQANG